MSVQEYVESFGYKVSDLTKKELEEVEGELYSIENELIDTEGFFSPTSPFVLRKQRES